jgi:predicted ATP-dependent endonuclease of OLD family
LALRNIVEEVAEAEGKQIIMTTHSSTLIDDFPWSKIRLTIKENGETRVISLDENKPIDNILARAGIPASWILLLNLPSTIVLVDSRDDVKIYEQFFKKASLDTRKSRIPIVAGGTDGGESESIRAARFLRKIRSPIPFVLILDSDNKKDKKTEDLKKEFKTDEFYVLGKKETEDYLIDAQAISAATGKKIEDVRKIIKETKGGGREKLEKVLKRLRYSSPDSGVKELVASRIDKLPDDILAMIKLVKEKARKTDK